MRLHTLEQKLPEHETAPPGQAAEARLVEPVLSQPALSEAHLVHPEVKHDGYFPGGKTRHRRRC
jgi:hypothetical protein